MSVPFGSDPWLDARLRNVPLPAGMLARLNQLAKEAAEEQGASGESGSPDASGSALGPKLFHPNQPVPLGPRISDEQLDWVLSDVPVPAGLRQRLERIAFEPRRRFSGRQLALAASLLVALGVGYLSRSMFFPAAQENAAPGTASVVAIGSTESGRDLNATSPDGQEELEGIDSVAVDSTDSYELDPEESIDDLRWRLMKASSDRIYLPDDIAEQIAQETNPSVRPNKRAVFASGDRTLDMLPELDLVSAGEKPRGIAAPMVAGYDHRFRARYGQNPFVSPSDHKKLQSLVVPLVTSSASYQAAWQALADRKLPAASDVRVEEFLAAVDYDYPPAAPGSLALRTAAGPSPFAEPGTRLLQVGVQAGPLAAQNHPGTLLTVVVDTSTSMRRGGRLAMVRRALVDVASQLAESDRFSLVLSSDESNFSVQAVGRDKLPQILAAIQAIEPERMTNIGAALETAFSAAVDPDNSAMARRVVLVTDGLVDLDDDAVKRIRTLVADVAAKGVPLQVLNAGGALFGRDRELLEHIAADGGGKLVNIVDADAIRFALLETLTGRNQIVAREASLKILFNPQVVAAYRLLGHETVTLTGATAAPSAIDLRAGEAACALIELRLKPQGGDDVATVELTWHDAASGEQRSARQRISRLQFAKSFVEAPLALQTGAILGQTAEVLRGSYFASGTRSLLPVLDLAAQASPLIVERPGMRAFLSFVEQAEKVRARGQKRP